MTSFFPAPYEDEILYSLIARYFRYMEIVSPKRGNVHLFSNCNVSATIDLPSHLDSFSKNTHDALGLSSEEIIEKLTLFPFYSNFLDESKCRDVADAMRGDRGEVIHNSIGISASILSKERIPKYCPMCLAEDFEKHGEGYWHRVHQIPEINICLVHDCWLVNYQPRGKELNRSRYIYPSASTLKGVTVRKNRNEHLLKVAQTFSLMLNNPTPFLTERFDYKKIAMAVGFKKGSRIDQKEFLISFLEYYSEDLLNQLIPHQDFSKEYQWINEILRRPRHFFHPLRHVLVRNFLESYRCNTTVKENSFGNGPWKCINKASDHFNENVINVVSFHIDSKSKRLIGKFTCSCGLIYSMSYLKNDQPFIRVLDWGEVWKSRLQIETGKGNSYREVARVLGVDVGTVIKQHKIINLANKEVTKSDNELIKQTNRQLWLELLDNFQLSKIENSRKANPKLYTWLYRNDTAWLIVTNKLNQKSSAQTELRLDWKELDQEMIKKLAEAVNKLKGEQYKGRISKSILGKIINKEHYLAANKLSKLPLTNKFLQREIESQQEYQIRRIEYAASELLRNGEPLIKWKIMQKAGLSKNLSRPVFAELNKVLMQA